MPYKDKETRNAHVRARYASDPAARENMLERSKSHNDAKRRASGAKKYVHHEGLPKSSDPGYQVAYYRKTRLDAIAALGGVCTHCGCDDVRILQFDHISGDGFKDRRDGRAATSLSVKRIIAGDRKTYQLLCPSCNQVKRVEGTEHLNYRR